MPTPKTTVHPVSEFLYALDSIEGREQTNLEDFCKKSRTETQSMGNPGGLAETVVKYLVIFNKLKKDLLKTQGDKCGW